MAATTTLKLDPELKERVKRLADAQRRTPHWLMREAIADYVARQEKRDSFKQEALMALNDYRETGLHLTGEAVDAWLETWGTDNEREAPDCRK